jgi:hypothetical protein
MTDKTNILGKITKIIFIGGAIILFILLAIWIIRLVPKAISGLGNIGNSVTSSIRGAEEINVSVNKSELDSKEAFVVSWDHSPATPGEYYLSYECSDSLIFDIQSSNGLKRILCNTPFKLGENIDSISLVPTITKENIFVDNTIEIYYKDFEQKEKVATGTTQLTLKNTDGSSTASNPFDANLAGSTVTTTPVEETPAQTTTTNTSTTSTTQNTSPSINTSFGRADLAITNIAQTEGRSELSFTVYNLGGSSTGNWYFTYTDAENPSRTVLSPIQPNLRSGQGLLLRVRFDGQANSSQVVNVFVDSTNSISETNESNNYSSVTIFGNRNSSNNNGNFNSNDDADLVIEDLEVGRLSGSRFIEDDDIDEDDDAAVQFTVRNRGGESTGNWRFEITNTPYDDDDDYNSGRQSSLRPGEEVTITVEFENPDEGSYNVEVEVDSRDDVDEERESNNDESERLRVRD